MPLKRGTSLIHCPGRDPSLLRLPEQLEDLIVTAIGDLLRAIAASIRFVNAEGVTGILTGEASEE
jgi:hypothetical protein